MDDKMNINDITGSLEIQAQNLRNFLMIIKSKQEALIKRDLDELTLSMESEEKYISIIDKEEENRLNFLAVLIEEYNLNVNSPELLKLPNFIAAVEDLVDEEEMKNLKNRQESVKQLTEKVITINNQNKQLLENAKSLVREIITSAVGDQKHSIIDRRI
jgi:hypothetical protein